MLIQTEYEFELPHGYADDSGTLHRRGTMRLACAADEILPMSDVRVQQNPAYLTIIILARVITKLGTIPQVDTKIVEKLFTAGSLSAYKSERSSCLQYNLSKMRSGG